MRFTLITCLLAVARAQPSFLSCAQICSSIVNLHYQPAGCDCSMQETTSRSLEMDDLGVYYEPAEVYALHRISFINPPIYIMNPASKLTLQATAPKIVWKRKLSQKHEDSKIKKETKLVNHKDTDRGNINIETNRRLSYLDIDIKNPVVAARTVQTQINNIDNVSEKDFADCVNLHRLVYPTLINNSQFLKKHDVDVKSNPSESEVMADINNKCNQSASIIKQSLQEIKNKWPKIKKSSNEMDVDSADYSTKMDSKRMPTVKGRISEGYLSNSLEEQDTQPTETSSISIISVPDNNTEYDVTENSLTHSRKLIEQENHNFTVDSPMITPTPLGEDFSEDWQKNNFSSMHSVEQIDTTEVLQNNDTPPTTKKSPFPFENSFEVLKDSVLNTDSKNNKNKNNQVQTDIPGENTFFKENELTVANEYEYNATISEISKNKTKGQTSSFFTTEPKTEENVASNMSFRSINKPQGGHQRNNYQINKTLSSESLILVENLDLKIAESTQQKNMHHMASQVQMPEETSPTTEFYLRSDYPNLEAMQSENTLSDFHLQPVPEHPDEFYTTINFNVAEQGVTEKEAYTSMSTIDKSRISGSNPVTYSHEDNSWNKAAYDSILLNNESTNNFNKTVSTRSAVSTYSSYDYSEISTTESIDASDELHSRPQNNGNQSSTFQIISKDHISMTAKHTKNPTEQTKISGAELIKTARHNKVKQTKNNEAKELSIYPFNLISKPIFMDYHNNSDISATNIEIEQQEKDFNKTLKDVESIYNNENIFSERYVTIPSIVTKELQNNTVLSSVSHEHLHDQDFLRIGTPAILDSNTPETGHINQTTISGKLFFIFDKVRIPARFVQKENGEIAMGIDGDTLCAKLNSEDNKSLLISSLCNGLFNNNCSNSILSKV